MNIIENAKRIKTIADTGLLYATDEYDIERYRELKKLSLELLSVSLNQSYDMIESILVPCVDYPTVKVDVRGLVIRNNTEILLVKEKSDQLWSLPGGWAEPGFSPSESIIKEVKEEAGLKVLAKRVLAVFDNRCHPHPPSLFSIFKIILLCEAINFEINKGFDILDVAFFPISDLPLLSENRILKSQIEKTYQVAVSDGNDVLFD